MKLPPIYPIDTSNPFPPPFDPKSYCQYHCQDSHDTEKCYRLKHAFQDFIDSNTIVVDGVNDKGNKFVAPPNQNLEIFTNPLSSISTNVVEHKDLSFIAAIDMFSEANSGEPKPKCDPCIIFESRDIIRAPDGPLYITTNTKGKLTRGVLIDLVCIVNAIRK